MKYEVFITIFCMHVETFFANNGPKLILIDITYSNYKKMFRKNFIKSILLKFALCIIYMHIFLNKLVWSLFFLTVVLKLKLHTSLFFQTTGETEEPENYKVRPIMWK